MNRIQVTPRVTFIMLLYIVTLDLDLIQWIEYMAKKLLLE